jgi:hypothetical protein
VIRLTYAKDNSYFTPDLKMIESILVELNDIFDSVDLYYHSTGCNMFEFDYKIDGNRRECWQITFMGNNVTSGGMFGMDYDYFYEDDYLFLIPENRNKIFDMAYTGAIEYISKMLEYVSRAEISLRDKGKWIDIINSGN